MPLLSSPAGPRLADSKIVRGRVENGWKHRFVDLDIEGLTEKAPAVKIDAAHLQVVTLFHVNVQPIGWHGSVVWDGNPTKPSFAFDGFPAEGPVRIRLEVWGS